MKQHYEEKIRLHGATAEGVDWGSDYENVLLRYRIMLNIMHFVRSSHPLPSLLDVGCGYGGLLGYAQKNSVPIDYLGIDVSPTMIEAGRKHFPQAKFLTGDFLDFQSSKNFDYIVCNGILTQKLGADDQAMTKYACEIIEKMFDMCLVGIAFNVMSTRVNYRVPNLYYKDMHWTIRWCMQKLSQRVVLDHAYPLYEYSVYVYK